MIFMRASGMVWAENLKREKLLRNGGSRSSGRVRTPIQNPKLRGLLMFPNFKGNDWYVFVFTTNEFSGELIDSPEGKLEWIPDEKMLGLNLWESDHTFMP
jgi:hypothetical protein